MKKQANNIGWGSSYNNPKRPTVKSTTKDLGDSIKEVGKAIINKVLKK